MPALLDLALRALILLAVAWTAVTVVRRASASLRACIWTAALGSILLLPALTSLVPAWPVPFLIPERPAIAGWSLVSLDSSQPARVIADDRRAVAATRAEILADVSPIGSAAAARPSAADVAVACWALIAAMLLMRLGASHVRLVRLAREARGTAPGWATIVARASRQLGVRRMVQVRTSDAISVPAIAGMIRPVLLLPPDADEWPDVVRQTVALHELAHVRRWDAFGQLVSQLACAVYWCVPLAWVGARRAALLRECASDDAVLRAGVKPSTYAENLVHIASAARGPAAQPALLAMARPSGMRERVVAILSPSARRSPIGPITFSSVLVAIGGFVVLLSAASTEYRHDEMIGDAQLPPFTAVSPVEAGARPPTAQTPAPSAQRICGGALDRSSSSITNDDGRRRWKVTLSGRDCDVDLRAGGRIDFTDDFTDVRAIDSSGYFRVDVTERGVRRQLEIEARNGALTRIWRVDGREQPYDAAARAWFAAFLVELDRRTAIGVEVRLPHLLRQGGVEAVLNETALITSDYARSRYYTTLASRTTLSSAEVARVLRQASSLTESDHYATELLRAFAPQGLRDATTRAAVIEMIERMDSDHYKSESVTSFLSAGEPSGQETELLLRIVPGIESDHYKLEVLKKALRGASLTPAQASSLTTAAKTIDSDHYRAEYLKALLAAAPAAGSADVVIGLTADMDSDHYRSEVFARLLQVSELREGELLGVVGATRGMGDHYASETLRRVARHSAASDKVRAAVLAAAGDLSRHYAEEVRRAIR
jgi:beta-lactamase regulating signal transducer with metallopeptidase domain